MIEILDDVYPVGIDDNNPYSINEDGYYYDDSNDYSVSDEYEDENDEDENDVVEEVPEIKKTKRGRKPKDRIYFGEEQEIAVVQYVTASRDVKEATKEILKLTLGFTDEQINELYELKGLLYLIELSNNVTIKDEKTKEVVNTYKYTIDANQKKMNVIYEEHLAAAFKKMVEAIIRGRELYLPNEEFSETYRDALSHLLTKVDKFDPSKGTKAYSYYSNIIKNYLIGKNEKYQKALIRNPSYDALELDFANNINYSTNNNDKSKRIAEEEVKLLTKRITEMVSLPENFGLKENEIKVGNALINLFENWDYVLSTDNSSKLNKSVVLLFLREQTGLDTKGIRDNLKKFKKEFLIIKDFIIS